MGYALFFCWMLFRSAVPAGSPRVGWGVLWVILCPVEVMGKLFLFLPLPGALYWLPGCPSPVTFVGQQPPAVLSPLVTGPRRVPVRGLPPGRSFQTSRMEALTLSHRRCMCVCMLGWQGSVHGGLRQSLLPYGGPTSCPSMNSDFPVLGQKLQTPSSIYPYAQDIWVNHHPG